jgi:hypothetical protein
VRFALLLLRMYLMLFMSCPIFSLFSFCLMLVHLLSTLQARIDLSRRKCVCSISDTSLLCQCQRFVTLPCSEFLWKFYIYPSLLPLSPSACFTLWSRIWSVPWFIIPFTYLTLLFYLFTFSVF